MSNKNPNIGSWIRSSFAQSPSKQWGFSSFKRQEARKDGNKNESNGARLVEKGKSIELLVITKVDDAKNKGTSNMDTLGRKGNGIENGNNTRSSAGVKTARNKGKENEEKREVGKGYFRWKLEKRKKKKNDYEGTG
ncbi:hypothetical protein ACH5RR_040652 [Cinchona calisaya]|uniref:Uncharacterized protein n=1 Tax=Cinchona calisaya TaxID=153742 RepID=A0ABD2XWM1_9GENT